MSAAIGFLFGSHLAPAWNWSALVNMLIGTGVDGQRNRGAESVV